MFLILHTLLLFLEYFISLCRSRYVDPDFLLVSDSCLKNFNIFLVWVMNIGYEFSVFLCLKHSYLTIVFRRYFQCVQNCYKFFLSVRNDVIPLSSAWHSFCWQVCCPSQLGFSVYIYIFFSSDCLQDFLTCFLVVLLKCAYVLPSPHPTWGFLRFIELWFDVFSSFGKFLVIF